MRFFGLMSTKRITFLIVALMVINEVAGAQDSGRHGRDLTGLSLEELLSIHVKTASMRQQKLSEAPATSVVSPATKFEKEVIRIWARSCAISQALTARDSITPSIAGLR